MNHNFSRLRAGKRTKGETAKLAAQLAPLEEHHESATKRQGPQAAVASNGGASQEVGAIVIDNSPTLLSAEIAEGRSSKAFLGMEPVVLVILIGMLFFIAFIAWQISLLPIESTS